MPFPWHILYVWPYLIFTAIPWGSLRWYSDHSTTIIITTAATTLRHVLLISAPEVGTTLTSIFFLTKKKKKGTENPKIIQWVHDRDGIFSLACSPALNHCTVLSLNILNTLCSPGTENYVLHTHTLKTINKNITKFIYIKI